MKISPTPPAMALTAAQHAAMEGEAPFPLPEEVVIAGRKHAGTRARVYWLLRLTAERGVSHLIGNRLGPAGWVPNYYLRKPWSGGFAGDRRVRDLRERGVRIELEPFDGDSSVVLYRWAGDPPAGISTGDDSRETRPMARGGQMGGLGEEVRGNGAVEGSRRATRLRFWTSVGFPGEAAPGRVELLAGGWRSHPLAISPQLFAAVVRGAIAPAAALASHDAALRRRWTDLRAWLEAGGEYVLWLPAEAAETVNPVPLVVEILGKCGAEYLGDWQQRRKESA